QNRSKGRAHGLSPVAYRRRLYPKLADNLKRMLATGDAGAARLYCAPTRMRGRDGPGAGRGTGSVVTGSRGAALTPGSSLAGTGARVAGLAPAVGAVLTGRRGAARTPRALMKSSSLTRSVTKYGLR